MNKVINLTAHSIYDVVTRVEFPPSKRIARVDTDRKVEHIPIEGSSKKVAVVNTIYKDIVGLPEKKDGIMYIVSAIVLNALQQRGSMRDDVVAPGKSIKDSHGANVGCEGFRRNG